MKRLRVNTVVCPTCEEAIYSRAHHDFRYCKCGDVNVDGGFDYLKYGWRPDLPQPTIKVRYVNATKEMLYDDWNNRTDKFGCMPK